MWRTFKFFFVWFWLALASLVLWYIIAAATAPAIVTGTHGEAAMPGTAAGVFTGIVFGFFMCIPAYFIARPSKRSVEE